tara:strand:- start:1432 stop:1776 length:345 start_codon:yes stop_codon:yes gene_type:complete
MENLESYAKERFELNRQKQTLREQQQQRLSVTYNGGLFRVDMTLLNYLYMKNANAGLFQQSTECVLPDSYDTPIQVDVTELLRLCDERWNEVHNDWYNQYEELKTKRRVKDVGA